jgi:hypothetical protein
MLKRGEYKKIDRKATFIGVLDPKTYAALFRVSAQNLREVLCGCLDLESYYKVLLDFFDFQTEEYVPLQSVLEAINS